MNNIEQLYCINLSYATFGIIVKNNIIIKTAPIGNWMLNKSIEYIIQWVSYKKGQIIKSC